MEKTSINFKRERDFGDVFSATFDFIHQEYKKIGILLLNYVLPFLVVVTVILILAQHKYVNIISGLSASSPENVFGLFGGVMFYWFVMMLIVLIAHSLVITATYSYVSVYVTRGKDAFEIMDVWNKMKSCLLPVIGTAFVVGLIIMIGAMLCVLPGIFLGASLSMIMVALIHEGKGFGNAFSRSFELSMQSWWMTLLIVIIAFLITYVLALLIQLPVAVMGIGSFWTSITEGISNPDHVPDTSKIFSTSYIILSSILGVLGYLLYIIPHLVLAFWYFSIVEKKEKPSLMEKIAQVGEDE